MEYVLVAYWTNGFGEECSSRVRSAFTDDGTDYVVVYDWRSRGLEVRKVVDCETVRRELAP